ncbi:hypothetical protein E2F50_18165 [Rhizobium deserti]|uniref:Uncharacterized protein n=1 Tax=Rhizobium deserti TaxID=2547961 RepID=A0A4R5UB13_9HYPH|nr:hypothetical protein [Rhizobium deserti]TDK32244.1 hypothetical protein E2F50_18165 [Rhizobium deserti]
MLKRITLAGAICLAVLPGQPVSAQDCNAAGTVGSAGSAAAGGTSASTLGTAGSCNTDDGATSSIASGGSAATADGKARSRTNTVDNPSKLQTQSKAQAVDKGTFSKSRTKTTVQSDSLDSTTRTMSHVPGQKPVKSTTNSSVTLPQQ